MNIVLSTVGRRGYVADYFRLHLGPGDRLIGTGNDPWTPGFLRCDDVVILPSIKDESYLDAVLTLCDDHGVDGLVSFADPDVHRLASIRDELAAIGVVAFVPSQRQATTAFDKYATYVDLTALGFTVPETTLDADEARGWNSPVFVKPRYGSGSNNVVHVTDAAHIDPAMAASPYEMIAQRAVEGEHVNVDLLCDLDDRLVRMCLWRRHRSRLGETELAETFHDSVLQETVIELGEALGFRGPMDIDLIRDEDGTVHVLDLNPRFGGGYPVSHLAGIDIPGVIVSLIHGEKVEKDLAYARDVVMMKELRVIGGPRDTFRDELGGRS